MLLLQKFVFKHKLFIFACYFPLMKSNFIAKDIIYSLSPLEADIIKSLLPNKKYRTRDIYALVRNKASKSSVSVILDRLYQKGLVKRDVENAKGGIRFVYSLEQNNERFEKRVVENVVNSIIQKFGPKAVVYFNESLKKRGKND